MKVILAYTVNFSMHYTLLSINVFNLKTLNKTF